MSITYMQAGDYQIPAIRAKKQPQISLCKLARQYQHYMETEQPLIFNELVMTDQWTEHIQEIDETARSRMERLLPMMQEQAGVTEELKANDHMAWVGLMNTIKAQAEEMVLADLKAMPINY